MTGPSRHAHKRDPLPPLRRLGSLTGFIILITTFVAGSAARAGPAAASRPDDPSAIATQMIKIVGQSEASARREAAVVVLRINSPEAVKALLDIFEADNNEQAKMAVAEAVAETRLQVPEFIPKLESLLQHKTSAVRKAAATALGVYTDRGVAARLDAFRQEQERALMAESLDHLMDGLYDATTDETKRNALLLEWLKSPLTLQRLKALQIVNDALRGKGTKPANEILAQIRVRHRGFEARVIWMVGSNRY